VPNWKRFWFGPALGDSISWKFSRRAASYAQRMVYSDEELLASLTTSLRFREQEIADRNTFMGHLLAFFVGEDPGDSIAIDGMRLRQLHELAGSKPKHEIDINGTYNVNLANFRILLGRAEKAAASEDRP